jgi:hypothetical protein
MTSVHHGREIAAQRHQLKHRAEPKATPGAPDGSLRASHLVISLSAVPNQIFNSIELIPVAATDFKFPRLF